MGAVIVFSPSLSGNKLIPVLENHGHVVSPNAHINLEWRVAKLSDLNVALSKGEYSRTVPQVTVGGWSEPIDIGVTIGQEFSEQKYTVKIEGTYDFDNGFGDRFTENFCNVWLGHALTKPDTGGIENTGAGLIPCNLFEEKLRYFQSHRLK